MASAEDFFEDSLLSLFDEHPFAFSTSGPDEQYVYHPPSSSTHPSDPVKLFLPVAPSALHSQLQLTHIWLSSIYLADLIFKDKIVVKGRRCAELGAGAGLPSIAALRCGAESVVSSDYAVEALDGGSESEDVLGVLRNNIGRACPEPRWVRERDWDVVGHTWATSVIPLLSAARASENGDHPTDEDEGTFDTLFLADLLWSSASHADLITSVRHLLRPASKSPDRNPPADVSPPEKPIDRGGTAHVIAGLHTGRGPVERFQAAWKEGGGWVEPRGEVRWAKGGEWEMYERPRRLKTAGSQGASAEDQEQTEWAEVDLTRERGVIVWFEIGLGSSGDARTIELSRHFSTA